MGIVWDRSASVPCAGDGLRKGERLMEYPVDPESAYLIVKPTSISASESFHQNAQKILFHADVTPSDYHASLQSRSPGATEPLFSI